MKSKSLLASQTVDVTKNQPSIRWFWWIIALCLAVQCGLAVDSAWRWTATHDEYWHLPIGQRIWKTGHFDEDVINPPLVRLWSAIPLVIGGADTGDLSPTKEVGEIGNRFWNANGGRAQFWYFLGRLMIIPCAAVTGLVIAVWTRAWYGDKAAIVAVLLWTCCPTGLANSVIVTHDAPLAAAWLLTLWRLVRFSENRSWRNALLFGAALGMALLTKLTAVILIPLSVVLWFVLGSPGTATTTTEISPADSSKPGEKVPFWMLLLKWGSAFGMALLIINLCYLFQGCGTTLGSMKFDSPQMLSLQASLAWFPVPLPVNFVAAFDRLAQDLERFHPVYLDSNWSIEPIGSYYAFALAYKLPLTTLALFPFGFSDIFWPRPGSRDRSRALFILIAALSLPLIASRSGNQIGIRYILPTLPLICIFASQSSRWLEVPSQLTLLNVATYRIVWVLVVAAPLSLRYHPHHLAYFNAIAGGPQNGAWHLVDSNIDWGQDLHGLRDYMRQKHISDIGLAYFGTVLPRSIGIESHDPPIGFPRQGWYAISVNFVHGRPHQFRNREGSTVRVGMGDLAYFRVFEPVTTIGYSINVYHITPRDLAKFETEWRAQNGRP